MHSDHWYHNPDNRRGCRLQDTGKNFKVLFSGGEPDFETLSFEDALDKVREYLKLAPEADPGERVVLNNSRESHG